MRLWVASFAQATFLAAGVLGGLVPAYSHDLGTPKYCNLWYDNDGAYPCKLIPALANITRQQYLAWNPSLDGTTCTPFNEKQSYCVGVCEKDCTTRTTSSSTRPSTASRHATTSTTTSTSGPQEATPSPIQDGMVRGCKAFTLVTKDSSCADIANQYGLAVSDLVSLNPAFKDDCSGKLPNYYACVRV
ncbi:hypothetical protein G6O67_007714 [Ophiocordyceps sinensis]|uniref:LysM domain-containing protein n=2 Tax=Ophiocordyceps sinensis TaxID=72228 RepID=A0A8H4LV79_9HYPO|nr:hypothetical protein OCS_02214 [Ophiocordyceps sinensis CO18]KAF4505801.1 hypothetical protein G6O67_007714 [Ophiocordyceps sinensis]